MVPNYRFLSCTLQVFAIAGLAFFEIVASEKGIGLSSSVILKETLPWDFESFYGKLNS